MQLLITRFVHSRQVGKKYCTVLQVNKDLARYDIIFEASLIFNQYFE